MRSGPANVRAGGVPATVMACGSALAICIATVSAPVPARADDAVMHQVTYTVTADGSIDVDVYYRDVDPPTWADYSHNPYQFSPKDEASLGPGQSWVRDVTLADPQQWAMVAVSRVSTRTAGTVRCTLTVDGTVVSTDGGPAGAVCSLRHW